MNGSNNPYNRAMVVTQEQRDDSDEAIAMGNGDVGSVYLATNMPLPNKNQDYTQFFMTRSFDVNNCWDNSIASINPTQDGYYRISWSFHMVGATATLISAESGMRINGTFVARGASVATNGTSFFQEFVSTGSILVYLANTDLVTFTARYNDLATGTVTLQGQSGGNGVCRFSWEFIRP